MARWRFQLLHAPDDDPGRRLAARSRSPAAGRCRTPGIGRSTRTSRCRSPIGRRRSRPRTRPASTSARSRLPASWAGRRVVLHVGRRRERADRPARRRGDRRRKDSHLAAEFDLTDRLRAGDAHAAPDGREVVRRHVHRGPGPVVARRDHPVRVPVRDRPRRTSPTCGSTPGWRTTTPPGRSRSRCPLAGDRDIGRRAGGRGDARRARGPLAGAVADAAAPARRPRRLGRPRTAPARRTGPRQPERGGRAHGRRRRRALGAGASPSCARSAWASCAWRPASPA